MKTNENMKIKKVFKRKVAIELRKMGFNIIGTEPNTYFPQFDVYLFEETDALLQAFNTAVMRQSNN